jgi:hypothetical protein
MQMDIRDMGFFGDESFDCVLDKGKLLASRFITLKKKSITFTQKPLN